ncbi:MAG: 2-oxoacid:acceptor oxidoreductase family protein [Desulfurococcaceae archaeon]
MLTEIRWHSRGGQGGWTASNLVAVAAAYEGKYVQSFPAFGPERSGAPILSFTRISDQPIELHSMIYNPDIVVVLDYTLLSPGIVKGLKPGGSIVTNYPGNVELVIERLGIKKGDYRVILVPATKLALEILRTNITNTAMIGGLLKLGGLISYESVEKAIRSRFSGPVAERNLLLIKRAFEEAVEV